MKKPSNESPEKLIDIEEYDNERNRLILNKEYEKAYSYCRIHRIKTASYVKANRKDTLASQLLSRFLFDEAMCLDLLGRLPESLRIALRANKIAQTHTQIWDRYSGYSIVSSYYIRLGDRDNARMCLLKAINAIMDGREKRFLRLIFQDLESLEIGSGNAEASEIYKSMKLALRRRRSSPRALSIAEKTDMLNQPLPD